MDKYRIESDSVGEKQVPADALYGVQTLRAYENFKITGDKMHPAMVKALAQVKKACAISNFEAGVMDEKVKDAIVKACDEVLTGNYNDSFITDPIQGGAGTSANMNANEVIANLAERVFGNEPGKYEFVHPNDHVNMGQSTNDVYPTAGKLGALYLLQPMKDELNQLIEALGKKADEFDDIVKMGRTQLQDAVPIRLGQEFAAYKNALLRDVDRIKAGEKAISFSNMGASAIGTGINVDTVYLQKIVPNLSKLTGFDLIQNDDLVDGTQNLDFLAYFSGILKTLALTLSKISNDLRLMSSGPRTGIGEINLPARQNGSSIMPGKVNPVIPEVVTQAAFLVAGNDTTVSMCVEAGQFELNAFEPVLYKCLYESIEALTGAMNTLRVNCIDGITANKERIDELLHRSVGMVTALVPHIGYKPAASIAKEALKTGESVKSIVLREKILTEDEIMEIFDPMELTKPGIAAKHLLEENK
ncbi:MAG: aspartate ammonia-lyase [Firmicutes bacterium]|nr:aspartate ammonia-lyase [Bacillota bacterium]